MMKQSRKARIKPDINGQLHLDNNNKLKSSAIIEQDCELQNSERCDYDSKDTDHFREENDYEYQSDYSNESDEENIRAKKKHGSQTQKTQYGVRTQKPCLGQIPEVEHKRVECQDKTGRIINDKILCDCCHKKYSVGGFEKHAGLFNHRNPYKTIFLIESGKPLNDYRYCSSCHTTETPLWMEGPLGPRTLCEGCGISFKNGKLKDVYLNSIRELSVYKECRDKQELPAKSFAIHSNNVQAVVEVDHKDLTYEHFYYHTVLRKEPLVIKNFNELLTKDLWSWDYLLGKYGNTDLAVRYMQHDPNDESQFGVLRDDDKTIQWFVDFHHGKAKDSDDELVWNEKSKDLIFKVVSEGFEKVVYAKDFSFSECAAEWKEDIVKNLPPFLVPHNKDYDLMGYIPEPARPIVWMGYIGNEGTRTPLHVDKLSSIAINLFAFGDPKPQETDEIDVVNDDVKTQQEAVKLWWFIDHRDSRKLEECLQKQQGSLHKDNFWMAPSELEGLGLRTWYFEQRPGDLVIVPPLVPHTVINRGGLSCAVAANVLNVNLVDYSWERERFNRSINRSSIYRLKPAVYFAVKNVLSEIQAMQHQDNSNAENLSVANNTIRIDKLNTNPRQVLELTENCVDLDAKLYKLYQMHDVYEGIVNEERAEGECIFDPADKYFTCDGCGAEIFNRRYHCDKCKVGDYDLCLQCTERFGKDNHYHKMVLCEKIKNQELVELLETARSILSKHMDTLKKHIEAVPLQTKTIPVERYEKDVEVISLPLDSVALPLSIIPPRALPERQKKQPSSPKRKKQSSQTTETGLVESGAEVRAPDTPTRTRKASRKSSGSDISQNESVFMTEGVAKLDEIVDNNTTETVSTAILVEDSTTGLRNLRIRKKVSYDEEMIDKFEQILEETPDSSKSRGRKKQPKLDEVTVQENVAVYNTSNNKEDTEKASDEIIIEEKPDHIPKRRGRKKKQPTLDEVTVQDNVDTVQPAEEMEIVNNISQPQPPSNSNDTGPTSNQENRRRALTSESEGESKQRKSQKTSLHADVEGAFSDSNLSGRTSSDDRAVEINLPVNETYSVNGRYPARRRTLESAAQLSATQKTKQPYKRTRTKSESKPLKIQELNDVVPDAEHDHAKETTSTKTESTEQRTRKRKKSTQQIAEHKQPNSSLESPASPESQPETPASKKSRFQKLDFTRVLEKTPSPPSVANNEPLVETVTEAPETQMAHEIDIVKPVITQESERVPLSRRRRKANSS